MELSSGQKVLGRYRIDLGLDIHSKHCVWRALDLIQNRDVVVKGPRSDTSLNEDAEIYRIIKEHQVYEYLKGTPHILEELDYDDKNHLLVLSYKPRSLADALSKRSDHKLSEADALTVTMGMLRALEALHDHAQRIIHRDLNPGNILLDERFNSYVCDFGEAEFSDNRSRERKQETTTAPRSVSEYLCPDLDKSSSGPATVHCDLYSVGVILFEMLTGKKYKTVDKDGELNEFMVRLPKKLRTIISSAVSDDSRTAYRDAEEMLRAVEHYVADKPNRRLSKIAITVSLILVVILVGIAINSNYGVMATFLTPGLVSVTPTEPALMSTALSRPSATVTMTPTSGPTPTPLPTPFLQLEDPVTLAESDQPFTPAELEFIKTHNLGQPADLRRYLLPVPSVQVPTDSWLVVRDSLATTLLGVQIIAASAEPTTSIQVPLAIFSTVTSIDARVELRHDDGPLLYFLDDQDQPYSDLPALPLVHLELQPIPPTPTPAPITYPDVTPMVVVSDQILNAIRTLTPEEVKQSYPWINTGAYPAANWQEYTATLDQVAVPQNSVLTVKSDRFSDILGATVILPMPTPQRDVQVSLVMPAVTNSVTGTASGTPSTTYHRAAVLTFQLHPITDTMQGPLDPNNAPPYPGPEAQTTAAVRLNSIEPTD